MKEAKLAEEMKAKEEADLRKHAEIMKERQVHAKTRSDMIVKFFSEKISPAIHDKAGKKEAFGGTHLDYHLCTEVSSSSMKALVNINCRTIWVESGLLN